MWAAPTDAAPRPPSYNGGMSTYALRLSTDEKQRYLAMARRAREDEADLWDAAGLRPGARVADVGCGPGAVLAVLAELVGPTGSAIGVDSDPDAVAAATALVADVGHARVRRAAADDTGLAPASFDTVVLRHVLAHNGGREQRIVDHLAGLLRPGGHLLLADVEVAAGIAAGVPPALMDLMECYHHWHLARGNDPSVGGRLPRLAAAAGLAVERVRATAIAAPFGRELRGPAWAARAELVRAGLATEADVERWDAAFGALTEPVEAAIPMSVVVACHAGAPGSTA